MQTTDRKYGVLMVQIGGPRSPDEVAQFIFEMLKDKHIIDLHPYLRYPFAFLVSRLRARKVKEQYNRIGGTSPIIETSCEQAEAVALTLEALGYHYPVEIGFRYCRPRIEEAVEKLAESGAKKIVFLPLYPQYSTTTTLSALDVARKAAQSLKIELEVIEDYADSPEFIEAWVERFRGSWDMLQKKEAVLLCFSAHGIPIKYVVRGDPYPSRIQKTVDGILGRIGHMEGVIASCLCYQSRFGRIKFLEPGILEALEEGKRKGAERVVVFPVSFVSDHLETLFELDITVRKKALALGYKEFVVVRPPSTSRLFINALSKLVIRRIFEEEKDVQWL